MTTKMSDEFNNDSMLELYLFEATTLLESLDAILLEAEQTRTLKTEDINETFRIMHTIKGSSAMMAFDTIAEVAHRTEDVFAVIRENGLDDSNFDRLFDLVLKASEFLEKEVTKIQEGAELSKGAPELIAELGDYEGLLRASCPSPRPKPNLGRMLGGAPTQKQPDAVVGEPAAIRTEPAPIANPEDMPEAPEGGRILGIEPAEAPDRRDGIAPEAPVPQPKARPVSSAVPGGENTVYLHVHFNEGARMENIRAFMLVNKLSELGTVNRIVPDDPENNTEAADYIIES
ncbi:MAG: Hpt domain-containing protein, partial [Clostridiales Family XIII bacterium]|nr:Hpt domain-containing protein [Clostridiales Family XIII bacterium]